MPESVSVIIPTFRRPLALAQCLASLARQTSRGFEVLVLDNAADRAVQELVEQLATRHDLPIRYLPEPRKGLHFARHTGAQAAQNELLLFTDDDATFDPHWIGAHQDAFSRYEQMVAAGGPVLPAWEQEPPDWLLTLASQDPKQFGVLSLMKPFDEFRLDQNCYFFGVNLAIRKQVLYAVGGFNPDSFGEKWLGDGESGLLRKLRDRGMKIGYVSDAVVHHHIPAERMTRGYFLSRAANQAAADAYSLFHPAVPSRRMLSVMMLRPVLQYTVFSLVALAFHRRKLRPLSIARAAQRTYSKGRITYIWRLLTDPDMRRLVSETNWLDADRTSRSTGATAP